MAEKGNVRGKYKEDFDYFIKLLVIGDSGVGKTSLIRRYTEKTFLGDLNRPIPLGYRLYDTILLGKRVTSQIWDTRFADKIDTYEGTRGIIVAYDVTNKGSFHNVPKWLAEIHQCASKDVHIILVGTKNDRKEAKVVATATAEQFAYENKIKFFETSAKLKTDSNIDSAFQTLIQDIFTGISSFMETPHIDKMHVSARATCTITYSDTGTVALQSINPWVIKGANLSTVYYFEVTIKSISRGFAIGLTTCSFPIKGQELGQLPNSFGYYGEDGLCVIHGGCQKTGWPKFKKGMVVGIGLIVSSSKIFGTLDGKFIDIMATTTAKQLIPTIGFHKPGEVSVTFDHGCHKYDTSILVNRAPVEMLEDIRTPIEKLLVLFAGNEGPGRELLTFVETAAKTFRKYGFQTYLCTRPSALASKIRQYVKVQEDSLELVVLNFKKGSYYVFQKDELSPPDNILKVCEAFMKAKSAPRPPKDQDPSCPSLMQVVGSSFSQLVLLGTRDMLLNVYHRENPLRSSMEILSKLCKDVVFAQIDSATNDLDSTFFPKNAPQKIFFVGHNRENPISYEGDQTVDNLLRFLHTRVRVKFDLEQMRMEAQEDADLRQLREIVTRRRKLLAQPKNEDTKKIQEVDHLYLSGISLLTQCTLGHSTLKRELALKYLGKAFDMVDRAKLSEAKCYLEMSLELDESTTSKKEVLELQAQIKERESLSEYELQMCVETRINAIKDDILHAEQQAQKMETQTEREVIEQQLAVLHQQEEKLSEQIQAYEARYQKLQEREAQVEQREQLVCEQTAQLAQLFAELVSTTQVDLSVLQQQMAVVEAGDKDVDSARRRFASMQKAAKEAQRALIVEERRQRERVEWLQKQMELYQVKGMSPAQLAFRNFLKDTKRLSSVRHQLEHTPHPLRCFISYAWETDPVANKDLQKRLQQLKDHLETAGMEVMLDIRDMKSDMKKFMVQNIDRAHKLLLMCTPRLQVRAADPIKNNLQLELETALEKEKSTPGFIVPLILSGTFSDAMPPQIAHLLSINLTPATDYHSGMAALAPMGLIPMLLDLERNKDYRRNHDRLFGELAEYEKLQIV